MDGPQNPNPQPPPDEPQTPAPSAAQPLTITPEIQALVEAAARKAHDAAFAEARRVFQAQSGKKGNAASAAAPEPTATPDFQWHNDLNDAMAELTLTRSQRRILRDAAVNSRPGDLDAFVGQFCRDAGWAKDAAASATAAAASAATAAAPPSAAAPAPSGAPAQTATHQPAATAPPPSVPAPATTAPQHAGTNPLQWDDDTWRAYVRSKGADPSDPYSPRNAQAWKEIAKMVTEQWASKRVR